MRFADLHCHPDFKAYQGLRNTPADYLSNPDYNPWNVGKINLRAMAEGKRAATFPESDFVRLTKGNVQLVFASLYPMEKGFFMGNHHFDVNSTTIATTVDHLHGGFLKKAGVWVLRNVFRQRVNAAVDFALNNQFIGRDLAEGFFLKFTQKRVNYFQNGQYNYWRELLTEKQFYETWEDKLPHNITASASNKFVIARHAGQVASVISQNGIPGTEKKIVVVLTIEGSHAYSLNNLLELEEEGIMEERIRLIRSWGIFFITFAHHFSNGLCGHAHSMPDELAIIADQKNLMNESFNATGRKMIRRFLALDDQLNETGERRILIDVKHMAARARKEYYETVVKPFNQINPGKKIPVIASHCGHSGYDTLDNLVAYQGEENNYTHVKEFYGWNINLCDEDIKVIVESGGIIGLSFDQRILGDIENAKASDQMAWTRRAWLNIKACVDAAYRLVSDRPERVWNCLAIGTDFDGMVDPLNSFSTAEKFPLFGECLIKLLKEQSLQSYFPAGNALSPEIIVEKIAFQNAYDFVITHF